MCAFVLAHEVAHHVLGHLNPDQAGRDPIEKEREADNWACDIFSDNGINPYVGSYVLDFEFGIRSVSAEHWKEFDHPHAIARMLNVIERSKKHGINKELTGQAVFDEIEARWKKEEASLQKLKTNIKK